MVGKGYSLYHSALLMFRKAYSILIGLIPLCHLCASNLATSPEPQELLEITGIHCDASLPEIVEATQKAWVRPFGKERWEIEEALDAPMQSRIVQICDKMGFFAEKAPKEPKYRYCCILGATLPRIQTRIEYAILLWNRGVRFEEVVLFSGDRPLDPRADQIALLETLPDNEMDGIKAVYDAMDLPTGFRDLPITQVRTPKVQDPRGLRRPAAMDTVSHWLTLAPEPGSALFISNQPYVHYFGAVTRFILPETIQCECVGYHVDTSFYQNKASLLLDTMAWWLYYEEKISYR